MIQRDFQNSANFVGFFCLLVYSFQITIAQPGRTAKEYCQYEFFNASCSSSTGVGSRYADDAVILMESAQYGRMHSGSCVSGNVGCSVDVLDLFDRRCSGRRSCSVYVSDPALHKLAPCSKEYTSYLEAKYSCLSVVGLGSMSGCSSRSRPITLTGRPAVGYIASAVLTEPDHRSSSGTTETNCPWKIQADPRQTIRLSLLSFSGGGGGPRGGLGPDGARRTDLGATDACYEAGEAREPGGQATVLSVCSESARESVFFLSKGSSVVVQLKTAEVLRAFPPFIIKYEVLGCRLLKPPLGGYVGVEGNMATVRCNDSKETWFLTCTGNTWLGHVGNCSDKASITNNHADVASLVDENFPYGILLVVAIGVALGVLIGGILLSCVAYYMKRQTRLHGYSEPADWTKQMLDEMEAYNNEAQRGMMPASCTGRYAHDSTVVQAPMTAAATSPSSAVVGLLGSPNRSADRVTVLGGGQHGGGCTCPKGDENGGGGYAARITGLQGGVGGGTTVLTDPSQSRFLYEIPQFSN